MSSYTLTRYEIVAPLVTNGGRESGYARALRSALTEAGFSGWTEFASVGNWQGVYEAGVTFVIYTDSKLAGETGEILALIGRRCMPDQEAVQVVIGPEVTLIEG